MLLSMAEVVRNRLRARINEILHQLASPNLVCDSQESVFFIVLKLCITQLWAFVGTILLCCG